MCECKKPEYLEKSVMHTQHQSIIGPLVVTQTYDIMTNDPVSYNYGMNTEGKIGRVSVETYLLLVSVGFMDSGQLLKKPVITVERPDLPEAHTALFQAIRLLQAEGKKFKIAPIEQ